jgi:hypothetical protein
LEAIDNVFKSQQECQVVLESKLETITSNMVMKDDLEKELKQLRDWIQVRPPSGDKSVLVKQEEELCKYFSQISVMILLLTRSQTVQIPMTAMTLYPPRREDAWRNIPSSWARQANRSN